MSPRFHAFIVLALLMLPFAGIADAPPAFTPGTPPLSDAQIDQLLAPVALYPDPLLAEILTASTYPVEIVEENRWLQQPANAGLSHDMLALETALSQQPWDKNVKALALFPQVLQQLDTIIQWTDALGAAFLAQQPQVLASVQRLRGQAIASGALLSNAQQTVGDINGIVTIDPANPQMLYAPYYNPVVVYGVWPWPAYPPFYFVPPPGVYLNGAFLFFTTGFIIVEPLFHHAHVNWPEHRVDTVTQHPQIAQLSLPLAPASPLVQTPWTHDTSHVHPAVDQTTVRVIEPLQIPAAPHFPPSHPVLANATQMQEHTQITGNGSTRATVTHTQVQNNGGQHGGSQNAQPAAR